MIDVYHHICILINQKLTKNTKFILLTSQKIYVILYPAIREVAKADRAKYGEIKGGSVIEIAPVFVFFVFLFMRIRSWK